MKRIIFFDGDGTLWYPQKTKHSTKPHWIYSHPETRENYLAHLVLTSNTALSLEEFKRRGLVLVLLSTHPHPFEEAQRLLRNKTDYFKITNLFDEIHATQDYKASKGEYILNILHERKLPKKDALMVGDTYDWDYLPAVQRGIDAILIESEYRKEHPDAKRVRRVIRTLAGINSYL